VRFRETSASEPLTRCRKQKGDVETGGLSLSQEKVQREPAYCLDGVRHAGGVNLIQALVWNVGTCRPDAKGEAQVGSTHEGENTDAGHRGGPTRTSVEVPVMGMERRGWVIRSYSLANQRWEEPGGKAKPLKER
jgi:hypothetical protein